MPLRNERQAYWDDIDAHIASVAPLDGDAALERACPRSAADREALRSRLAAVEDEMSALRLARRRVASESRVLDAEADADARVERKASELERAERYVRGRLENDRAEGQRIGMAPDARAPRAAVARLKPDRVVPFAVPDPYDRAARNREVQERWGGAQMSPLMGGGYTVVLERARRDAEEAEARRAEAERVRALYFMPPSDAHDPDGRDDDEENVWDPQNTNRREAEGAALALRGWDADAVAERRSSAAKSARRDEPDDDAASVESALPPPRGSNPGTARAASSLAPFEERGGAGGVSRANDGSRPPRRNPASDGASSRSRVGSGYGSQLAMIGSGAAAPPPPPRRSTRSVIC